MLCFQEGYHHCPHSALDRSKEAEGGREEVPSQVRELLTFYCARATEHKLGGVMG